MKIIIIKDDKSGILAGQVKDLPTPVCLDLIKRGFASDDLNYKIKTEPETEQKDLKTKPKKTK